jgi:hypothetical protein
MSRNRSTPRLTVIAPLVLAAVAILAGLLSAAPGRASAAATRTITVCKLVEDNGDGVDQGGTFSFEVRVGPPGKDTLATVLQVPAAEGAAAACRSADVPDSDFVTTVETEARPATWASDEKGYPKNDGAGARETVRLDRKRTRVTYTNRAAATTASPGPSPVTKAKPLTPILECVRDNFDGTYTAYWGYENSGAEVTIPVGERNTFSPATFNSALPTRFAAGRTAAFPASAFSLTWDGGGIEWKLTGPDSVTRSAAASAKANACRAPRLIKEFVSDSRSAVTWRLRPEFDDWMTVTDPAIATCEAFNGADCGAITSGGSASFRATGNGQYLLVTQNYAADGQECSVHNTASWARPDGTSGNVSATYTCSGASALGWPLLAVAFTGAVAVAWWVRRGNAWSRSSS